MVCWSLVLHALRDAGYIINAGFIDCNTFSLLYPEVNGQRRHGDLVLYDWDKDGSYDHMGIISDYVTSTDPKSHNVISVTNVVREFQLGAAERRLGCFEDIPINEGGDTDYNFKIVRPQ